MNEAKALPGGYRGISSGRTASVKVKRYETVWHGGKLEAIWHLWGVGTCGGPTGEEFNAS